MFLQILMMMMMMMMMMLMMMIIKNIQSVNALPLGWNMKTILYQVY